MPPGAAWRIRMCADLGIRARNLCVPARVLAFLHRSWHLRVNLGIRARFLALVRGLAVLLMDSVVAQSGAPSVNGSSDHFKKIETADCGRLRKIL